ncbi:MAG: OmpA family protein, partial [Paramuribaculum sp.]|nr:OmpA family protein [Paramuribaculum sp.]
MKKILAAAIVSMSVFAASAQDAYYVPGFDHNWSFGLDGGATTTLAHHHAFWGDMRGMVGAHVQKQISPVFGLGIEAVWGINTSSWFGKKRGVVFDNQYVGVYGSANLFNLFGGYKHRVFDIELAAGAGWGHDYVWGGYNGYGDKDANYFMTKAGVNFNFNIGNNWTIALKPSVSWNMTGSPYGAPFHINQTSCGYDRENATFNVLVGVTYHFNPQFVKAEMANPGEIDALNAEINSLRAEIEATEAATAATMASLAATQAELDACMNQKPEVEQVVTNDAPTYIFFKLGSAKIYSDQQPYMENLAKYMTENPSVKIMVKGYASEDGPKAVNERLSVARAEAVKTMLVNKYGIDASRIEAKGEGIGHMFDQLSLNRVSICTVE